MIKYIHIGLFSLMMAFFLVSSPAYAVNQEHPTSKLHSSQVMEQFNQDEAVAPERAISTKNKHLILFWMGSTLLVLVLLAAGFGVAMGIFDKDVFVWHVLSAGLATTLAIAHGVVAFVWFYPS